MRLSPSIPSPSAPRSGEAGYLLLGAVVLVALVLISLAVAAPVIARDIRRDKEMESAHRAEQYLRAIRLYQRKCRCQAYPATMEALEKNNTERYLRQKYIDPLTGKSDWRLIHDPQTKIHVMFGQTFDDLPAGTLGTAQGMVSGGQPTTSGGASGATGATGSTGPSSSSDTGMFGDSNGGPIKGVGTSRTGDSILNPNGQTTYETWEFWWDPRMEQLYAKSNVLGGGGLGSVSSTSATGLGNNINGASGPTGSSGPTGPKTTSPITSGFGPG